MSMNSSAKSANSDSKSKRSFNSMSSNPSSSNNSNNTTKKKKTCQKTLGVAWGSNSHSSSRSSFRSSPFSDFGSYMVVKNQKLHEQFDAEASSSSHSGSLRQKLFKGVSIFVDGYTIPSSQELRGYMLKFGGRFENYFSRHHVTHIICSNLPDSKIKNLRSFSGGLPVVKPKWIVDSVAANRLLSWVPYQLDQLASEIQNQPKLSSFFTVKSSPVSLDATTCVTSPGASESENALMEGGTEVDVNFPAELGATEHIRKLIRESDNPVHVNSSGAIDEVPSCSGGSQSEAEVIGGNYISIEGGCRDEIQPQSSSCQDSASVWSDSVNDPKTKSSSSKTARPSTHRHSTLTDINFVESYFKSSRLHFIGTWRTRYRKRFPNSSNGFKCKNSSDSSMSQNSIIIHVDMDCFFVSVVIRNRPELQDKPVAVCHSDNPRGTAEISSANYPARDYGVKAGMFVRDAKARCPHLIIFPYDFEAYGEVADQFYNILHKYCNKVQAVSCDEAFLDVTDSSVEDPQLLSSIIRKEILDTTGCTASAGIAGNMLMARLATRIAKPDGQSYIPLEKVEDFLLELPVKALPGIGHVLEGKLKRKQIRTCGQLRTVSKESLQKDFGMKTGDMLWNYSRGIDNRPVGVIQESKSIGAEVNWGVRFNDLNDAQQFLVKLSKEVALRLQGCGVQGRTFTLKIKKRKNDAGEPMKYLGCGDCENLSHSTTVPAATDDAEVLKRITTQLFGYFHIDVKDIRGMGLQVSKLEDADGAKQGSEKGSIRSWLLSASAKIGDRHEIGRPSRTVYTGFVNQIVDRSFDEYSSGPHGKMDAGLSIGEVNINQDMTLPPLHDLDMGVLESLPPEVLAEINDMYGGKLITFISKSKSNSVRISDIITEVPQSVAGVSREGHGSPSNSFVPSNKPVCDQIEGASGRDIPVKNSMKSSMEEKKEEENQDTNVGIQVVSVSGQRTSHLGIPDALSGNISLMPSSLSQIDTSVLQQLPEDLRADILDLLPAHRMPESAPDVSLNINNQMEPRGSSSNDDLWVGSPPCWIHKFKESSCAMLKMFSELYMRDGSSGRLSSMLQHAMSDICIYSNVDTDTRDIAGSCLCELFKQYVNLKIETDIEEIYICSRLLQRLSTRSKFFIQLYDRFLPHLQASVAEIYGGSIHIFPLKD